jgi:hypothetical protein
VQRRKGASHGASRVVSADTLLFDLDLFVAAVLTYDDGKLPAGLLADSTRSTRAVCRSG